MHLESISNTILWEYRAELPTVWRLMQQSMFYSRFNAASTSTTMCIDAITRGNCTIDDRLSRYKAQTKNPYEYWNLFHDIAHYGYEVKRFFLDHFTTRGVIDRGPWFITNDTNAFNQGLRKCLSNWRATGKNFFIHFQNDIAHMAFDDEVKIRAKSFSERFRLAYMQLDASINFLLQQLAEFGFWENTLIVCYGDHGDELWGHSLTRGFCHAIAPYASLVWTPLFIYDNGRTVGVSDQLVSAVDLRETLVKAIIPDFRCPPEGFPFRTIPFSGRDIASEKNEYVFSQNLYGLQLEYADLEQALTKGYSVTDGIYRLVAASGGKRPKDGGMEFYYDRLDPTNSRNLLDFFQLGVDGEIIGFAPPPEATSEEFKLLFTPETVRHMTESFHALRRELRNYVRAKEAEALKHNRLEYHVMPDTAFKYARRRIRKDYDE